MGIELVLPQSCTIQVWVSLTTATTLSQSCSPAVNEKKRPVYSWFLYTVIDDCGIAVAVFENTY